MVAVAVLDDNPNRDGHLNYLVSTIIDDVYPRNYTSLNAAIGVLECIKQELYRRVVAPYEDTKIEQNGDVYFS
jgi:hypothetical protein